MRVRRHRATRRRLLLDHAGKHGVVDPGTASALVALVALGGVGFAAAPRLVALVLRVVHHAVVQLERGARAIQARGQVRGERLPERLRGLREEPVAVLAELGVVQRGVEAGGGGGHRRRHVRRHRLGAPGGGDEHTENLERARARAQVVVPRRGEARLQPRKKRGKVRVHRLPRRRRRGRDGAQHGFPRLRRPASVDRRVRHVERGLDVGRDVLLLQALQPRVQHVDGALQAPRVRLARERRERRGEHGSVEARGVRHALGELPERERRRAAHVARRVSQRGDHRRHDLRHGALESLRAPFSDDPEHGDARVPSPRAVGHRRGGVRQRVRRERQHLGKHVLGRRVERQQVHQARRNRLHVLLVLVVDFRGVAGELALLGLAAQRAKRAQQRRHHLGAAQRLGLVPGQERYRVQRAAARDGVQVARAGDFHAKRHDVFDSARQGPRLRLRQLVQHLERQRRVPLLADRDRVARDREHGEHQPAQNVRLVLRAPRGRVRGERQRGAQRRGAHAR